MKNSTTKKIVLILAALCAIGIFANLAFFFLIKNTIVKSYGSENNSAKEIAAQIKVERLRGLVNTIQATSTSLESRVVGSDNGTVDFLNSLETIAQNKNLVITIQSVDTSDTNVPHPEKFEWLTLSFNVIGSWQNIYTFTSLLEQLPYKIMIPTATFTTTGASAISQTASSTASHAGAQWSGVFSIQVLKEK